METTHSVIVKRVCLNGAVHTLIQMSDSNTTITIPGIAPITVDFGPATSTIAPTTNVPTNVAKNDTATTATITTATAKGMDIKPQVVVAASDITVEPSPLDLFVSVPLLGAIIGTCVLRGRDGSVLVDYDYFAGRSEFRNCLTLITSVWSKFTMDELMHWSDHITKIKYTPNIDTTKYTGVQTSDMNDNSDFMYAPRQLSNGQVIREIIQLAKSMSYEPKPAHSVLHLIVRTNTGKLLEVTF
jgi:hypothetical protein